MMNDNVYIVSDMGNNDFYFCDSLKTAREIAIRLLFKRKEELFEQYTSKIYDRLNEEKAYYSKFESFWEFVVGIVDDDIMLFEYDIDIYPIKNPNIISLDDIDKAIPKNY